MKITSKVNRVVVKPIVNIDLNLTLSLPEAIVLRTLCNAIGGSQGGPRGLFDAINAELKKLRVITDESIFNDDEGRNIIYFNDDMPSCDFD